MDARRGLDLLLSAGALHVFSPVQLAAACAIRLEDGGPVVFRQVRLGKDRVPFEILKLRTMRGGRVTRVGRYLRATGLDETLQFWCVLRGDMSIVGPRPLTAEDVARLGWSGPAHDGRFRVRPGITGLAQVYGGRSARHTRALDALYARRATLGLDLSLIAISFGMNLAGKARVRRWLRRRGV
ncbi:MAG: sugar transferase [Sandaracinaceae bacterium]|nr:sugar transferase [Sandaracinaceae bacterium]